MAKNNKWIFIGLGAVILLAVLFLPTKTKDKDFLEVRFYDTNGNLIGSTESFSSLQYVTVTPPGISGISQIDFVVRAHNLPSSTVNLDFTLKTLTQSNGGTEFNNAFTKSTITNIVPDDYAVWTSNKIAIPPSWVGQSIIFTAIVGAQFGTTTLADKSGSITLTFTQDPTGAFEVLVGSGTFASNAQFRTGSLNYPGTSVLTDAWIAYSNADIASFTCGSNLVGYGFDTVTRNTLTCNGQFGTPVLDNLPHTPTIHLTINPGDGIWSLHRPAAGYLQVCEDESDGAGNGRIQYAVVNYPSTTPAATDTQGATVDSSREISC